MLTTAHPPLFASSARPSENVPIFDFGPYANSRSASSWRTSTASRPGPWAYSSISRSPSELPNAATGRRPITRLIPSGLPPLVVDQEYLGQLHQHRLAVAEFVPRLGGRADHLLGRHPVDRLGVHADELLAAAGHDVRLEPVGPQVPHHLPHRLVDQLRVRPPEPRVPRSRQ